MPLTKSVRNVEILKRIFNLKTMQNSLFGINSAPAQFLTSIGAERISDKQGVIAVLCQ